MRRVLAFLAVAAVAVSMGVPAAAGGGGGDAAKKLYPPDAEPFGWSYAEWQGVYQIWLNEIPAPENPIVDPASPLNCAEQRGGKVVFLGPAGANCTVSDEAALAVTSVFGFWECSTAEGLGDTWAELRSCARNNFARDLDPDIFHQSVYIDGKRLRHQRDWVDLTPGEIIDFPDPNIWNAEPGLSKSVTKGFLFILRPLSEGRHRIVIDVLADVISSTEFHFVWKLHVVDEDD